jgi:gas vesicle protein
LAVGVSGKGAGLQSYIVRGILIGGSIGVFAGLFGLFDIARGAALGMIAGFFAGLTLEKKRERERRKKP